MPGPPQCGRTAALLSIRPERLNDWAIFVRNFWTWLGLSREISSCWGTRQRAFYTTPMKKKSSGTRILCTLGGSSTELAWWPGFIPRGPLWHSDTAWTGNTGWLTTCRRHCRVQVWWLLGGSQGRMPWQFENQLMRLAVDSNISVINWHHATISANLCHFCLLQVSVTAREDVPPFGPVLPDPPVFTDVRKNRASSVSVYFVYVFIYSLMQQLQPIHIFLGILYFICFVSNIHLMSTAIFSQKCQWTSNV